jgi:hypothetical protein
MTAWTSDELDQIGQAEELQISPRRQDGSLAPPRTIWVVRQGEDLYIRSVNGRTSAWFRGIQARHQGHIDAGGVSRDVGLAEPDADMADELDAAYQSKYRRYPANIVGSVSTPQARDATLRLLPA